MTERSTPLEDRGPIDRARLEACEEYISERFEHMASLAFHGKGERGAMYKCSFEGGVGKLAVKFASSPGEDKEADAEHGILRGVLPFIGFRHAAYSFGHHKPTGALITSFLKGSHVAAADLTSSQMKDTVDVAAKLLESAPLGFHYDSYVSDSDPFYRFADAIRVRYGVPAEIFSHNPSMFPEVRKVEQTAKEDPTGELAAFLDEQKLPLHDYDGATFLIDQFSDRCRKILRFGHGDLHLGNMLFSDAYKVEVCDWSTMRVMHPATDFANFLTHDTSQGLSDEMRQEAARQFISQVHKNTAISHEVADTIEEDFPKINRRLEFLWLLRYLKSLSESRIERQQTLGGSDFDRDAYLYRQKEKAMARVAILEQQL